MTILTQKQLERELLSLGIHPDTVASVLLQSVFGLEKRRVQELLNEFTELVQENVGTMSQERREVAVLAWLKLNRLFDRYNRADNRYASLSIKEEWSDALESLQGTLQEKYPSLRIVLNDTYEVIASCDGFEPVNLESLLDDSQRVILSHVAVSKWNRFLFLFYVEGNIIQVDLNQPILPWVDYLRCAISNLQPASCPCGLQD